MTAVVAFALASALHAGFQTTVTALVYPVLGHRKAEEWADAHSRHSRSIVPLVVVVYGLVVTTGAWYVSSGPDAVGWLAIVAAGGALATTALAAAPTHGRLTERDEALVTRLLVADRVRCACAIVSAVLASVAVVTLG